MIVFWKIVPYWVYFGQDGDFKLTTELSGTVLSQPGNQKRLKWSNTAYVNKRSFTFKIKFSVFQATKTYCQRASLGWRREAGEAAAL